MRKWVGVLCGLAVGAALLGAPGAEAQGKANRPSPPAKAECKLSDGKSITIDYSSPRAKGRKVYGELVPFGQEWRTGANEATTFVVGSNVTVGGKAVAAGSYTLYTVPNANEWTLVVSKATGQWGVPYPGASQDLTRAPMKVSKLPAAVENFTISLTPNASGCTLNIDWETTRASVEIKK